MRHQQFMAVLKEANEETGDPLSEEEIVKNIRKVSQASIANPKILITHPWIPSCRMTFFTNIIQTPNPKPQTLNPKSPVVGRLSLHRRAASSRNQEGYKAQPSCRARRHRLFSHPGLAQFQPYIRLYIPGRDKTSVRKVGKSFVYSSRTLICPKP
jgi:hypothetical protein